MKFAVISQDDLVCFKHFFDERAYVVCKFFMSQVGVWPYQKHKDQIWRQIFIVLCYASMLPPQIGGANQAFDVDYYLVMESLSPMLAMITSLIKYLNPIIQPKKLRTIFFSIAKDKMHFINCRGYEMMLKYEEEGRKICIYYTTYIYTSMTVYLCIPSIPILLDSIHPVNGSHERNYLYQVEYGIDKEKYFYQILLHGYIVTVVVVSIIIALDTMYIIFVQHACALFAMLGYRLKTIHIFGKITNEDQYEHTLETYDNRILFMEDQERIYKNLVVCIEEHKNAIASVFLFWYSNLLDSTFSMPIFFQFVVIVLCISIAGVQTVMGSTRDMLRFGSFTVAQILHLFFLCIPGQRLLDHSERLHTNLCEMKWYEYSKKSKALYKFLLSRCLIPCKLTAMRFVTVSTDTFSAVVRTAMSYFTVFSSMKE